jgi:hypothetical protein
MTVDEEGCRMNNPDDMNDKDFVWRDNYSKEDPIDQYENEGASDDYENQIYETGDRIYRKLFLRLLIISAVWFLVLVIFFIVISKSQDSAGKKQILAIEKRLDRLETDFTSIKTLIASKLDQAIKQMEQHQHKTTAQKKPSVKTPPPAQNEQMDVEAKVHKVQAGDSLYQISLQYGLSIELIREYNNLEPNAIIYPGQELKLTP